MRRAGKRTTSPSTATRPSSIQRSASRREQTPNLESARASDSGPLDSPAAAASGRPPGWPRGGLMAGSLAGGGARGRIAERERHPPFAHHVAIHPGHALQAADLAAQPHHVPSRSTVSPAATGRR